MIVMAKAPKETKAPAEGETAPATVGEAAKARAMKAAGDLFKHTGNALEQGKRIAPQANVIVEAIKTAGEPGITRANLETALTGVLVTRQPVGRIVSYYQKDLVELGLVTLTKA